MYLIGFGKLPHPIYNNLASLSVNGARKYDIESEAHSIYGTDLKTVLQKFRHSPEYLKILEDKSDQISTQLSSIFTQLVFFFQNEMKDKIVKSLIKPGEDVEKAQRHLFLRSKYNPLRARLRQAEEEQGTVSAKDEESKSPNKILDDYVAQMRKLPASYITRVVHGLVKNLGGDYVSQEARSTHGADWPKEKKTTEHVTLHTVTTPSDVTPFIPSHDGDEGGHTPPETAEAPAYYGN